MESRDMPGGQDAPNHAVPVFEGPASRRHRRAPVAELRAAARAERAARPLDTGGACFVQFAGFPRSGHSILGAILGAHPDAAVSHELDAMGLVRHGLPMEEIEALIAANARDFAAQGRFWNGFRYDVPGAGGARPSRPLVVGDKKADWALRHLAAEPAALERLRAGLGPRRSAWIAVIRNPWDNVATLSLRKGRRYDALRIETGGGDFAARLAAEQGDAIAAEALPEMVEDYARLCDALAALKARVASEDWFELRQDALIANPISTVRRLLSFLGLPDPDGFSDRAAAIVSATPSRTRDQVAWPAARRDEMAALIARHDFLAGFDGPTPPRPPAQPREALPLRLVSCLGVDGPGAGDLPLLGHFLAHYAGLGVPPERMHLILNARDAACEGLGRARETLARFGAAPPEIWIGPYTSGAMWERRRSLQTRVAGPEEWVINADADEFHDHPAPLGEVLAFCEARGVRCVQGPFVDRLAEDGRLAPVDPHRPLDAQFPLAVDAGVAIGKRPGVEDATGTVKMMLHRGDVLPSLGGHGPQAATPEMMVYGQQLMHFPRAKSTPWRASLPFRVRHFKWTEGLAARLGERRAATGASPAGSLYGGRILDHLERNGGRIDTAALPRVPQAPAAGDWRDRVAALADAAERMRAPRARAARRRAAARATAASLAPGWRLRQLTFGSGDGIRHAHSYYDIPVLNADATRIAAYCMEIEGRWMTPEDGVEIGAVDVARGGFSPLGRSHAWSWQQGPMAQWLPDGRRLVWNDRAPGDAAGDAFVARLHDTGTGATRDLERPVYALSPDGRAALSLNMARLDRARPGYGYPGGRDARLDIGAPEDDGIWRLDLDARGGAARLILPLSRAVAFLASRLPEAERAEHLSGALVHWFNHAKVSPDGRRFTVKLRWRAADLKGPWTGLMGVSLTCGMDGGDLSLLARGSSHVMWLDAERLCFWHQAERCFVEMRDAVPEGTDRRVPFPDRIGANVHFRHIPAAPRWAIYDTPYAEEIDLMRLDRRTGAAERLVRFTGHVPHHGPFRCDLHPVPSRDGRRIVVTSLQDGGRQLYVLEREDA